MEQSEVALPAESAVERLFYSIGEVSDLTGVEPYVLRYWESEFKILHPTKRSSGQRSYQKKDIETILMIKKLLYGDLYTIAGARKKLREVRAGEDNSAETPVPLVIERVAKDEEALNLLMEIRAQLGELEKEINN